MRKIKLVLILLLFLPFKVSIYAMEPSPPQIPLCEELINPENIQDLTPEFSWTFLDPDEGDSQSAYQILVDTNYDFDGTVMWDSGKVVSTDTDVSYNNNSGGIELSRGSTYYWKVKAWDQSDNGSNYTDPQRFSLVGSEFSQLGAIVIRDAQVASPLYCYCENQKNPSGVDDLTPEFSWNFIDPNDGDTQSAYQIEVNYKPDLSGYELWNSGKVVSSNSKLITYDGEALEENGCVIYWRIRTWDNEDNPGPYSSVQYFVLADSDPESAALEVICRINEMPSAPQNLLCEGFSNPVEVTNPRPYFSSIFDDADGSGELAEYYQIQVDDEIDFLTTIWDSTKTVLWAPLTENSRCSDIQFDGSDLARDGVTYYWRMKYWDEGGMEGEWSGSGTNYFTMRGSSAPDEPVISWITADSSSELTINGTEGSYSTIKIYENGNFLGETVTGADGTWTFYTALSSALAPGEHVFTATSSYDGEASSSARGPCSLVISSNIFKDDTTYYGVGPTGSSLRFEGTTAFDFKFAVNAAQQVTVKAYLRYDSTTYSGELPVIALSGLGIGESDFSIQTMTVAPDVWELLEVSGTPNAKGVLGLHVETFSISGGKAWIDNIQVDQ